MTLVLIPVLYGCTPGVATGIGLGVVASAPEIYLISKLNQETPADKAEREFSEVVRSISWYSDPDLIESLNVERWLAGNDETFERMIRSTLKDPNSYIFYEARVGRIKGDATRRVAIMWITTATNSFGGRVQVRTIVELTDDRDLRKVLYLGGRK